MDALSLKQNELIVVQEQLTQYKRNVEERLKFFDKEIALYHELFGSSQKLYQKATEHSTIQAESLKIQQEIANKLKELSAMKEQASSALTQIHRIYRIASGQKQLLDRLKRVLNEHPFQSSTTTEKS